VQASTHYNGGNSCDSGSDAVHHWAGISSNAQLQFGTAAGAAAAAAAGPCRGQQGSHDSSVTPGQQAHMSAHCPHYRPRPEAGLRGPLHFFHTAGRSY
jgi:hypothetical protein